MRGSGGNYAVKAIRGSRVIASIEVSTIPVIVAIFYMNFISVFQNI